MEPVIGVARYNQGLSGVVGSIYSDEESEMLPVFVAGQVLAGDVLRKYLELVKSRNCTVSAYSS